jgi:hypothetical protein
VKGIFLRGSAGLWMQIMLARFSGKKREILYCNVFEIQNV